MLEYCPNCKTKKIDNVSNTSNKLSEFVFTNTRGGYGSIFRNKLCDHCRYPLCGVFYDVNEKTAEDEIDYKVNIIDSYQNGVYMSKEKMLDIVKEANKVRIEKLQKELNRLIEVNDMCDYFKD